MRSVVAKTSLVPNRLPGPDRLRLACPSAPRQVLLVCFAGMMAGLTLGLLSLDKWACALRADACNDCWDACACSQQLRPANHSCANVCICVCGGVHFTSKSNTKCPCRVDLEVIKRSGSEKQRWLVTQVEPVSLLACLGLKSV